MVLRVVLRHSFRREPGGRRIDAHTTQASPSSRPCRACMPRADCRRQCRRRRNKRANRHTCCHMRRNSNWSSGGLAAVRGGSVAVAEQRVAHDAAAPAAARGRCVGRRRARCPACAAVARVGRQRAAGAGAVGRPRAARSGAHAAAADGARGAGISASAAIAVVARQITANAAAIRQSFRPHETLHIPPPHVVPDGQAFPHVPQL